jgi:hypothetical protein
MKVFTLALMLSVLTTSGFSQAKIIELSHYLFPEFVKGTVLMKNGIRNEAMLNYNSLTEEMIFENNGVKLAISQLEQVDTVFISGRKFLIHENKFRELLYSSKSIELFAEHKCSIKDPGKPAAYGGTSQTSATTSYSSYFSGGQVYELKLPDGYETKPYIQYWINKDGKISRILALRQLNKVFDDKEDLLKAYVKTNEVKLDDLQSIVALVKYMDSIH